MSVLEQLYRLEIEFHRMYRLLATNASEASAVHTSYALHHGYEPLLRSVGAVDHASLAGAKDRLASGRDARDVIAAYHSLRQLVA